MKIKTGFFFVMMLLMSCNGRVSQQQSTTTNHITSIDAVSKAFNTVDTIGIDTVAIPNATDTFSANILTVGIFHEDEVWATAYKETWFGLFSNPKGYYLAQTKVAFSRIQDPIFEGDDTTNRAWRIQAYNKDTSILLISKLDFLKDRKVTQATLSKNEIMPGDTFVFKFLKKEYKLFATGIKKKYEPTSLQDDIFNYKLYLSASKNGKDVTDLLVAQPNFSNEMINIIFAGDIDGDDLLDLIIDTSRHDDASSPTLYLSKPANKPNLLKIVGTHTSIGC